MTADRRWVQRLIDEERSPAVLLLVAGLFGVIFANVADTSVIDRVLHFGPTAMPLVRFASEGLLVVFFYVAGLELRHELTQGNLTSLRAALVPVLAAALGMVIPALIFVAIDPSHASTAWGLPIATDLPLALALLAIAGRALPPGFRAFLLTLAIVDDALSIIVIAVAFGTHIALPWLACTAALVGMFALAVRRSGLLALVIAIASWLAMLQTGIHPTVLGVALGLVTAGSTDAIRDRCQPYAAFVAVPVFASTVLAVPISGDAVDWRMVGALTLARVAGKPIGILLGAMLAVRLASPSEHLSPAMYARAGSVAGLGFSVSLLFADLALPALERPSAIVAILMALCAAAVAGTITLRRAPSTL